jgi:GNAT superfamily N-acetyltransferase
MTTSPGAPAATVTPEPVGAAGSAALLLAYYTEIVGRYVRLHEGRQARADEVAEAMAAEPSCHLAPPGGEFLVARLPGGPAGCAGVHLLDAGTAELARVYVAPWARRCGLGSRLVTAAEEAAVRLGARRLRLDTRADLVEARTMYARRGYAEISAYHDGRYADHFFEKRLTP